MFLDAYTIRKAVPRLVIAVIGINLSIYLCVAMIDIVNVVGHGLGNLMSAPFVNNSEFARTSIENNATNTIFIAGSLGMIGLIAGMVGAAGGLGGALVIGGLAGFQFLPVIVGFMITIALIILAILFTLVIRQAIIIFCTIISPVAIALFVLPGTEKYFKKWWELFTKALMVYPIVAALFTVSTIMTTILIGTAPADAGFIGLTKILSALVVAFAPLVMIPFAFKLAGGAITAVMNAGANGARTLSGGARKATQAWIDDPNSIAGQKRDQLRGSAIDRGVTSRQLWARRPGGGAQRTERMQSARSLDEKVQGARLQDTQRWKARGQDSDVLDSLTMTSDQVAASRAEHRQAIADANSVLRNSSSTSEARQQARNQIAKSQRILNAHADADQIGRTTAAAQSAALSADRIKFTGNNHAQEMAMLKRVFGEEGAAEAANAHQAIAKGPAGRTDLAGSLYGQSYDLDRASSSQSMYALMNNGRPDAVGNLIDGHVQRLQSSSATPEEKERSAIYLESVVASKGSGTPANNQVVNDKMDSIQAEMNSYVAARGREIIPDAPASKVTDQEKIEWSRSVIKQDISTKALSSRHMSRDEIEHLQQQQKEEKEKK